jgi:hypothetical protein
MWMECGGSTPLFTGRLDGPSERPKNETKAKTAKPSGSFMLKI